jgi:hypothetical protein
LNPINVYFPKAVKKRLDNKLEFLAGRGSQNLANKVADEVWLGNQHDRLAGLDRYGKRQTPVKPRKGRYAGATGPPLAPFGNLSRVISHFRAQVFKRGGKYKIVAGWENVVSSKGVPFLPFHDQGAILSRGKSAKSKPGRGRPGFFERAFARAKAWSTGKGILPRRPIFGLSPRTWSKIRAHLDAFRAKVRKVK